MHGGRGRDDGGSGGGRSWLARGSSGPWRQWSRGGGRGSSGGNSGPGPSSRPWNRGRGGERGSSSGPGRRGPEPSTSTWQWGRGGGLGSSSWQWPTGTGRGNDSLGSGSGRGPEPSWEWGNGHGHNKANNRGPMPWEDKNKKDKTKIAFISHPHVRNFGDFDPVRNAETLRRSTPRQLLSELELDRRVILRGPSSSPPSTSPFEGQNPAGSGTGMRDSQVKQEQPQSGNSHHWQQEDNEEDDLDDVVVKEEVEYVGFVPGPRPSSRSGESVRTEDVEWIGIGCKSGGQAQGQQWGTSGLPNYSPGGGAGNHVPRRVPLPSMNQSYHRPPPIFVPLRTRQQPSYNQYNPDSDDDDDEDQMHSYGSRSDPHKSFQRASAQPPFASSSPRTTTAQKSPTQAEFNSNERIARASRADEDGQFRIAIQREDPNNPSCPAPVRKANWLVDYNRPGFF